MSNRAPGPGAPDRRPPGRLLSVQRPAIPARRCALPARRGRQWGTPVRGARFPAQPGVSLCGPGDDADGRVRLPRSGGRWSPGLERRPGPGAGARGTAWSASDDEDRLPADRLGPRRECSAATGRLSRLTPQTLPRELRPDPGRRGERGHTIGGSDPQQCLSAAPRVLLSGAAGDPADRLPLSSGTGPGLLRRPAVHGELGGVLEDHVTSVSDGARASLCRMLCTVSIHWVSPDAARQSQYSLPQRRMVLYPPSLRAPNMVRIAAGLTLLGLV